MYSTASGNASLGIIGQCSGYPNMTGFPRSTEWLQIKEDPPGDKRARQTRPGGGLWPATVLTQTGVCRQVDPGTHCSISFRYLSFSSAAFWAISFFLLKHKFTLACWSPCGRSSLFLQLIPDLRKVLNFSSRLPSKDAWTRFGCWGSRSKKIWAWTPVWFCLALLSQDSALPGMGG